MPPGVRCCDSRFQLQFNGRDHGEGSNLSKRLQTTAANHLTAYCSSRVRNGAKIIVLVYVSVEKRHRRVGSFDMNHVMDVRSQVELGNVLS